MIWFRLSIPEPWGSVEVHSISNPQPNLELSWSDSDLEEGNSTMRAQTTAAFSRAATGGSIRALNRATPRGECDSSTQ